MTLLINECKSFVFPNILVTSDYKIWYILHPNICEMKFCHGWLKFDGIPLVGNNNSNIMICSARMFSIRKDK